jgi:hypothetical protein
MKRTLSCAALAAAVFTSAFAQTPDSKFMTPNKAGSNPMKAEATVGGKKIWIIYHAPSVKGRKVFGAPDSLQPEGSIWRLGADWATFLHTDADLDLNGLAVPAGEYTLYMDLDKGKWQLIVNKQVGQWGIKRDGSTTMDESKNVGKAAMTMGKPGSLVETLKIDLSSTGGNKGKLNVEWENVTASLNFTAK